MNIVCSKEISQDEKISSEKLIDLILKSRQIKNKKEFLNPPDPVNINLTDFGPLAGGLKKTLKLLEQIKKNNQTIVVYTDYDADGITGGAILWETLHLLGFKAMPYVPHRKLEGYGFSIKGIDAVKKLYNPALIISVDHGITAKEKITYAKKLGIPVIVTDHHLKPEKTPDDSLAVFHLPALSGSGVAYFFAKEIFDYFKNIKTEAVEDPPAGGGKTASVKVNWQLLTTYFNCDYLALASIGSIADLVPLLGPTRSIVKYGLEAFNQIKRVGIKHILQQSGISGRKITPYEVGYIIAPRINAVGRLEHAIDALRLLCTKKESQAFQLANHVGDKNRERQDMVSKAVEEARQMINNPKSAFRNNKLIILCAKDWHEGIIGLIASKIAEEFYRPTIILTESNGFLKGSARSIPTFHITDFLRSLKKYLIDVGGHLGAAGFTMEKKKFNHFCAIALKLSRKIIKDTDLERKIEVDIKLPLSKLNMPIVRELEKLQPFGIGNPQPTFYSDVEILDARTFGKNNDHLKIVVRNTQNQLTIKNYQLPIEMIAFDKAREQSSLSRGKKVNIVYSIEIDRWGGSEKLKGRVIMINSNKK